MQLVPIGRFDWERLVRRIVMPKSPKFLALVLATYADPDGTRVRPGIEVLTGVTGDSDKTVRRLMGMLRNDFGLLQQVSRGGGRGGRGRAAEYRLTIPIDLLERHELLGPDGRPSPLTGHEMTGQSAESQDIQVTGDSGPPDADHDPDAESPVTNATDQSPVDTANDRSPGDPTNPIERSNPPIDRSPMGDRLPATNQPQQDQPCAHPPTPPPTARDGVGEPDAPASRLPPPARCSHGLTGARHPDGSPRCPFCRRDAITDTRPHSTVELAEVNAMAAGAPT